MMRNVDDCKPLMLGSFAEWSRRAREKMPGVKIAFLSINRAPQKQPWQGSAG